MNFPFWVNIIALLFSFFVVGAVLGAAFSNPFRKRLVDTLHLKQLLLDAPAPTDPLLLHEPHETDSLEGVAAAERMKNG
jgi:hypothetical protein